MPSRAKTLLFFLLLLVPSGQFAWRNRAMPQFAYLHDDGLLFISAKSLAAGEYRIASLPENPPQTKFPPLYPLYLSAVWMLNPNFPDNLKVATLLCWLVLLVLLCLALKYYLQNGLSTRRAFLLVGLLGVNPYMVLFGSTMFTEVFFLGWVLAVFLAASRKGLQMAFFAGILAGCAYLSRTAGIALLVSVPAAMVWKREWKRAAVFLAGMLPAVIAWTLWTRTHTVPTTDDTLLFYTDYIRYQFLNVDLHNLPVVLWKNLDQLLYGMGSLALPKVLDMLPVKVLTQVIAVAMIAGVVRLARRGFGLDYILFAIVSAGILLLWHFPPTERFVLPFYPLLLAGLVTEIEHIWAMLRAGFRHKDRSQRVVAGALSAGVVVAFGAALALQVFVTFVFLKQSAEQKIDKLRDLRTAYTWISANLPPSATILSYDDPLMYLYTSHRGNYRPLPTRWWYADDHASIVAAYRELPEYCGRRGLEYVYFTSEDLGREANDQDRQEVERVVRGNPELIPLFHAGIGTVYKVGAPSRRARR